MIVNFDKALVFVYALGKDAPEFAGKLPPLDQRRGNRNVK
jgi:hypothetical protein